MTSVVIKKSLAQVHVAISDSIGVCHARLGRPALGTIKELSKKGLLRCKDSDSDANCEECVLGKAKKLPYPKAVHTSTKPLHYAHSDLWGPAQQKSIGGGKYYMCIIDDFPKKVWIYILKVKSEAFSKF